jgi:predicted transcriptional regulator
MHVVASRPRYIGKETDRKWDQGEDFSRMTFKRAQFDELSKKVKADAGLIETLAALPIKEIVRKTNIDRNTIRKVLRGSAVRRATIQQIVLALGEWSPTR